MTSFEYLSVPAADLERIRLAGRDDHSHAVVPRTAGGGEPLRCCLTLATEGERILLMSYQPSTLGGPYAEIGPVFVHAESCAGPAGEGFPSQYADRAAVLRPYDAEGQMLDGVLAHHGEAETALKELFEDPRVALVHHRNIVAGCWNFSVRRASA
jgi:hypothetical protein